MNIFPGILRRPGGKVRAYSAWKQEQMEELAAAIQTVAGAWVVTVNDSAANRKLWSFGKQQQITRPRGITNKSPQVAATYAELIISKA